MCPAAAARWKKGMMINTWRGIGTIISVSISVWVLGYLFKRKSSIWALWSSSVKTRRDVNIIYSCQHYIFLWMRKLRPVEMKGLPHIDSKVRADPRIGPGCLNCQCWSFNKVHSMCYPSIAHPTHWTKSKYLLLLSWNENNKCLDEQWSFDEHSCSASYIQQKKTSEMLSRQQRFGEKPSMLSSPCDKNGGFWIMLQLKKKVVLGLAMESSGKTTVQPTRWPGLHPQTQKREERKWGVMKTGMEGKTEGERRMGAWKREELTFNHNPKNLHRKEKNIWHHI